MGARFVRPQPLGIRADGYHLAEHGEQALVFLPAVVGTEEFLSLVDGNQESGGNGLVAVPGTGSRHSLPG
uniref:Uncharacterized protein n=1 Tax=Candidatus Kentrum sp. TUN TaxID=2126343 RepID=A0A450ZLZ7_9GAMM|nr:MAG: hypothetical protein BECKTUN1418F_GA0071002_10553 [Candidatus Kentron sp. TUN]VFK59178.1 MAG: hypothetical protein BECKTUN1418E_GA0071001_10523 [Candidatus Kentron sp. TUN]